MDKRVYVAPSITTAGSLQQLTLTQDKFQTHSPDGILFHPVSGPTIPLTS
jgi:hypothetical protein